MDRFGDRHVLGVVDGDAHRDVAIAGVVHALAEQDDVVEVVGLPADRHIGDSPVLADIERVREVVGPLLDDDRLARLEVVEGVLRAPTRCPPRRRCSRQAAGRRAMGRGWARSKPSDPRADRTRDVNASTSGLLRSSCGCSSEKVRPGFRRRGGSGAGAKSPMPVRKANAPLGSRIDDGPIRHGSPANAIRQCKPGREPIGRWMCRSIQERCVAIDGGMGIEFRASRAHRPRS